MRAFLVGACLAVFACRSPQDARVDAADARPPGPIVTSPPPSRTPTTSAPATAPSTDASACPPLEVTLDGKPVELPNVLARGHSNGGLEVMLLNRRSVTCGEVLAPLMEVKGSDVDVSVIARMTPDAVALQQVVWDNDIVDAQTRLVGAAPGVEGDAVQACVPEVLTLHGKANHPSQTLTIRGLVRGRYCGRFK